MSNFLPWWPEHWSNELTAGFGLAMISALWAYDGWLSISLNAGEFRNPQRNIPLSLIIGTITVIVLYIAANLAYTLIIPLPDMAGSPHIAADVAGRVFGEIGAALIIIGILCSTFGTTNGQLLSGPRSIYAAGIDGCFSPKLAKVHPRFQTPYIAILSMGSWACLLTLTGTFEQITSYVIFASWGFYALTVVSVIILRYKMPDLPRPYKAWGYPYATLAFVAVAGWFLYNTVRADTRDAAIGIFMIVISLPFYFFWTRKK
jgi:APA family basic amino acid/polyamine antiporter